MGLLSLLVIAVPVVFLTACGSNSETPLATPDNVTINSSTVSWDWDGNFLGSWDGKENVVDMDTLPYLRMFFIRAQVGETILFTLADPISADALNSRVLVDLTAVSAWWATDGFFSGTHDLRNFPVSGDVTISVRQTHSDKNANILRRSEWSNQVIWVR